MWSCDWILTNGTWEETWPVKHQPGGIPHSLSPQVVVWKVFQGSQRRKEAEREGGCVPEPLLTRKRAPPHTRNPRNDRSEKHTVSCWAAGTAGSVGLLAFPDEPRVGPHSCPAPLAKPSPAIWSYTVEKWHLPVERSSRKRQRVFPCFKDFPLGHTQSTWIQLPKTTGSHQEKVLNAYAFWPQWYHAAHSLKWRRHHPQ